MYVVPELRTQKDLVADVRAMLRDPGRDRWHESEPKRQMNRALEQWHGRVLVPMLYTMAGWETGVYEYDLPDYIRGPIQPQGKVLVPYVGTNGDTRQLVWADLHGWGLEPDGKGGQVLRLQFNEGVVGASNEARLLWWAENGPMPLQEVKLASGIGSTDTTLTLDKAPRVGRAGFVKIGDEWVQYAGTSESGGQLTLQNLVRGVRSTASSHSSGDPVLWGVAVTDPTLWTQLSHQTLAYLHGLFLTAAPSREVEHHQWQMRWYQQQADDYWQRFTPARAPRLKRGRRAGVVYR